MVIQWNWYCPTRAPTRLKTCVFGNDFSPQGGRERFESLPFSAMEVQATDRSIMLNPSGRLGVVTEVN
jgi:hypothetical protein